MHLLTYRTKHPGTVALLELSVSEDASIDERVTGASSKVTSQEITILKDSFR